MTKESGFDPGMGKGFLFSLQCPNSLLATTSHSFMVLYPFQGIKKPWCETDHSYPSTVKVKNEQNYTSIHFPICLHAVVFIKQRNGFNVFTCTYGQSQGFLRGGGEARMFGDKLTLNLFKTIFTHCPRAFRMKNNLKDTSILWH